MEPDRAATRVLIADNDVAVNRLLADLLVDRGLQCEAVNDGEAALARLRAGGVSVLVTDLDMPKLSGQDLLQHMVEIEPAPRTIVVSGYVDARIEEELLKIPTVRHILRKPFDVIEFADLVEKLANESSDPVGG
jgi:DNA-binding NtrC family response regulator